MKSSQINSIGNEGLLQTTKPLSFRQHGFQWNVGLIYIHRINPKFKKMLQSIAQLRW